MDLTDQISHGNAGELCDVVPSRSVFDLRRVRMGSFKRLTFYELNIRILGNSQRMIPVFEHRKDQSFAQRFKPISPTCSSPSLP